jgi:hypothetical protein
MSSRRAPIVGPRAGWRIREIPTTYRARVGDSKLDTFGDGWRHLRLIALLAPDLLLVYPGAAALVIGLLLSVWTLLAPEGIAVGSVNWQPVFFSTIAMVLGAEARRGLRRTPARRRVRPPPVAFVGRPRPEALVAVRLAFRYLARTPPSVSQATRARRGPSRSPRWRRACSSSGAWSPRSGS